MGGASKSTLRAVGGRRVDELQVERGSTRVASSPYFYLNGDVKSLGYTGWGPLVFK